MSKPATPFVIQIVGYSGSGKTTLLTGVARLLTKRGWKVGTVKHHPKEWEWDQPGKDTWKHRQVSTGPVAIVSRDRTVIEWPYSASPEDLLPFYQGADLVLVEGFKRAHHHKLVMVHQEEDRELLNLPHIIALVSSDPQQWCQWGRCLHWDDVESVVEMITEAVCK
ncbi:molybdopterin-guanine dinucleotide biosynthesis protein B [Desmospora activa]|uniref:Molybdopterin guanine dinucleotide biosynthesis accessory protein MobB n=1 Tax=Desmospora activa DSM 45169 TaxID=1121389 RepID=A0A2T4Z948_9BACL|nr:molybdopterin-guanine dinucleotide biosynthesis protein B [Desmospora activa]PTM58414.1 molybdopterin guanine dinucleotide biosynthesis accessory protein MobB [Desmospora activa DSM 45169]